MKNSAGQAYYQVMESYWDGKRSKQWPICSLKRVGEDGEKKLDKPAAAISKYRDTLTITQLSPTFSNESTRQKLLFI